MTEEVWKDIPGFEGRHKVSNFGRIMGRHKKYGKNELKNEYSILNTRKKENGYCHFIVKCYDNNSGFKRFSVHRAMALAFIPNPENKKYINHKNGIKHDNRLENIEWSTPKENIHHAFKNGLIKTRAKYWLGKYGRRQKYPCGFFTADGILIRQYKSVSEASRELGYTPLTIRRICNNLTSTEYPFVFKYINP